MCYSVRESRVLYIYFIECIVSSYIYIPPHTHKHNSPWYYFRWYQSWSIVKSFSHLNDVFGSCFFIGFHPWLSQELSLTKRIEKKSLLCRRRWKVHKKNPTHSLRMFIKIWWSRYVICSAISNADNVSILSLLAVYVIRNWQTNKNLF